MLIDISQKITVDAKVGIDAFYSQLVYQMYYAMNQAGEVYLGIARGHIKPVTGQLAASGQVQDVDVNWSVGYWQTVARFSVDYSFGRNPDSFTSVEWAQTEAQQRILGRDPLEADPRAIKLETGFYAWEQQKKSAWVKRPYLYQGVPYIIPAFIDFMKDWDQIGDPMTHVDRAKSDFYAEMAANIEINPAESYYGAFDNE